MLGELAERLRAEFGSAYGVDNLELFLRFYAEYPQLLAHTPVNPAEASPANISDAPRRKSGAAPALRYATRQESDRNDLLIETKKAADIRRAADNYSPRRLSVAGPSRLRRTKTDNPRLESRVARVCCQFIAKIFTSASAWRNEGLVAVPCLSTSRPDDQ